MGGYPYNIRTIASGGRDNTVSVYGITSTTVQVLAENPNRVRAVIVNDDPGATTIFLGLTSNFSPGTTIANCGGLDAGNNTGILLDGYIGPVYAGHGVSSGASVAPIWVKAIDISHPV